MWRGKRKFVVQLEDPKPDEAQADFNSIVLEEESVTPSDVNSVSEWTECWDEKYHRVYYWNQLSNETKWELPAGTESSPTGKVSTPPMAKPDSFRNLIIGGKPKLPEPLKESQSSPALATLVSSYGSDEEDQPDAKVVSKRAKVDKKAEFRQKFSKELYGFSQESLSDAEFDKKSKEVQLRSLDRVGFQKMSFIKSDLLLPQSLETSVSAAACKVETADVCVQTESTPVTESQVMETRNALLSRLEHFGVTAEMVGSSMSTLAVLYVEMKSLTKAFDQQVLPASYLAEFFKDADRSLRRYETESVPVGWEMLWDRRLKRASRYKYRNRETKEVQFTYPNPNDLNSSVSRSPPPLPADPYPQVPLPPPPANTDGGESTKTEDDEYELFMQSLAEEYLADDAEKTNDETVDNV